MTIDLSDGLDFGEVMQIMKWLNVTKLLKPDLHKQLLDGTNSLLAITSALQNLPPWLLNFFPGNIGADIAGGVKALQLVKGLLDA
jgi:hypothetical protein